MDGHKSDLKTASLVRRGMKRLKQKKMRDQRHLLEDETFALKIVPQIFNKYRTGILQAVSLLDLRVWRRASYRKQLRQRINIICIILNIHLLYLVFNCKNYNRSRNNEVLRTQQHIIIFLCLFYFKSIKIIGILTKISKYRLVTQGPVYTVKNIRLGLFRFMTR